METNRDVCRLLGGWAHIDGVDEVDVEIVWDPPWNRDMMTEEAQLQLGMM